MTGYLSIKYLHKNKFSLSPENYEWISPHRQDPEDATSATITFDPNDMDDVGIIYLKDPVSTSYMASFAASRISLKKLSGPSKIFFDFVGKFYIFAFDKLCIKYITEF